MKIHPRAKRLSVLFVFLSALLFARPAAAQKRDSVLNGTIIGAAIGAGIGVGFNYALRDSDLTVGQYAYGALVFGGLGAGIGLGVDALFNRSPRSFAPQRRLLFAPAVGRVNGLAVRWRW
jgi:hypothetical protein